MWFLVNLPGNKLKIAVKSDRNSIAAECLNKVSIIIIIKSSSQRFKG